MPDVNGRRRYDASSRRDRARATRSAIVASARELFEESGYASTTIAAVARHASVSPESIYKTFGTKAALVKEVFDVVIGGDDAPIAVADRPEADDIRAAPTAADKIRMYADQAAIRAARSARIQIAIRDGRHGDPALDSLWSEVKTQRLHGMTMFGGHLLSTGELRPGIEQAEVRDILWTHISVEVYELLVLERGWDLDAFGSWLGSTLVNQLIGPTA